MESCNNDKLKKANTWLVYQPSGDGQARDHAKHVDKQNFVQDALWEGNVELVAYFQRTISNVKMTCCKNE